MLADHQTERAHSDPELRQGHGSCGGTTAGKWQDRSPQRSTRTTKRNGNHDACQKQWPSHAMRRAKHRRQLQAALDLIRQQRAVLTSLDLEDDEGSSKCERARELARRLSHIAPCIDAQIGAAIEHQYEHSSWKLVPRNKQIMCNGAKHVFSERMDSLSPGKIRQIQRAGAMPADRCLESHVATQGGLPCAEGNTEGDEDGGYLDKDGGKLPAEEASSRVAEHGDAIDDVAPVNAADTCDGDGDVGGSANCHATTIGEEFNVGESDSERDERSDGDRSPSSWLHDDAPKGNCRYHEPGKEQCIYCPCCNLYFPIQHGGGPIQNVAELQSDFCNAKHVYSDHHQWQGGEPGQGALFQLRAEAPPFRPSVETYIKVSQVMHPVMGHGLILGCWQQRMLDLMRNGQGNVHVAQQGYPPPKCEPGDSGDDLESFLAVQDAVRVRGECESGDSGGDLESSLAAQDAVRARGDVVFHPMQTSSFKLFPLVGHGLILSQWQQCMLARERQQIYHNEGACAGPHKNSLPLDIQGWQADDADQDNADGPWDVQAHTRQEASARKIAERKRQKQKARRTMRHLLEDGSSEQQSNFEKIDIVPQVHAEEIIKEVPVVQEQGITKQEPQIELNLMSLVRHFWEGVWAWLVSCLDVDGSQAAPTKSMLRRERRRNRKRVQQEQRGRWHERACESDEWEM